jgi:hypothetical protein
LKEISMSSMDGQPALGIAQRVSFDKREWIWLATVVSTCVAVPVLAACSSSSPHSVGAPVGAALASPVTVREAPETDFYGYNGTVQTASAQNGHVQIQARGGRGGRGEDAGIANGGLSTEVSVSWRVRQGQKIVMYIGAGGADWAKSGGGSGGKSGGGSSRSGGVAGCSKAGGGDASTVVTIDDVVVVVAGGGGGGGQYGATLSDLAGTGGTAASAGKGSDGHGPGAGRGGASGQDRTAPRPGGSGGGGAHLGGCGGGGGGGWAGGGGGGGTTGGGGGAGGGAGGNYVHGEANAPVYTSSTGYGTAGNGSVSLTFSPE